MLKIQQQLLVNGSHYITIQTESGKYLSVIINEHDKRAKIISRPYQFKLETAEYVDPSD